MLADLLLGYISYAPGTLLIKGLMAVAAALLFKLLRNKTGRIAATAIGGAAAECIMVFGYFAYESTLLGYGLAAAASILSNVFQGVVGLVLGVTIYQILYHIPAIRRNVNVF